MEVHGFGYRVTLVRSGNDINTRSCLPSRNSFSQIGASQPLPLTLKPCQSLKNEALRYPRVRLQTKHPSILANAYTPEEDAGREVESPEDKVPSQTGTVAERESGASVGKENADDDFWRGVMEETGQIEWPPFPRVLGTTGLVLAVIVGSSAVLFTVNAILAELSDKIFDGIGVQDILWSDK